MTQLYAFSINHDMDSTYSFSTLSSTLSIKSGDASVTSLGCILVRLTPDLGTALKATFRYVPLAILVLVGVATMVAAIYSPWGSTDMFRWTTNYSRDEDILRLVTPGFADCLQYIQFVVLTGALSLNYPGYYQPVVSQAAWSSLMFNSSFVSDGDGRDPVVDGIYNVDGGYGLERLSHLVGMEASKDTWPGTIIWTLVVVGSVGVLAQLAFAFRCLHRRTGNITEEDRRVRNVPFTFGNVIRVVFNYLLLPVSSISLFQLVVAPESPAYSVALACVVIVILILFILWAIRLIATTRPRALLFDEPSKVLLYGTFYNNFRESSVVFAAVPLVLNFIRGIAVGAVQPSGVAQIVLLAICEVVFILTIITFRPFPRSTSMNVYHVIFSSVRFVCVLLSVSFVPALNVEESTRGWVGYVIFVLHALVFVFGFFLNAVQTLVEVLARLAGAGDYDGRATRGGLAEVLLPYFSLFHRSYRLLTLGIRFLVNDNFHDAYQDAVFVVITSAQRTQCSRKPTALYHIAGACQGVLHCSSRVELPQPTIDPAWDWNLVPGRIAGRIVLVYTDRRRWEVGPCLLRERRRQAVHRPQASRWRWCHQILTTDLLDHGNEPWEPLIPRI